MITDLKHMPIVHSACFVRMGVLISQGFFESSHVSSVRRLHVAVAWGGAIDKAPELNRNKI